MIKIWKVWEVNICKEAKNVKYKCPSAGYKYTGILVKWDTLIQILDPKLRFSWHTNDLEID